MTEERIRLEKEKQAQLEKERQEALEEKRRKQAELDRLEREKQVAWVQINTKFDRKSLKMFKHLFWVLKRTISLRRFF